MGALAFALSAAWPQSAAAIKIAEDGDVTVNLFLRVQARAELERIRPTTGPEWQRDFLVRRSRLWLQGKVHGAEYKMQFKVDSYDANGANPPAQVEDAYIQYPLGKGIDVRAGLYDQPFSRDRLTSDGKQLAVDRASVSDVLSNLGLADNATGLQLMGTWNGGRTVGAVGAFDNRFIQARFQDTPMIVGRLDLNFGSTKNVFVDTHFGDEERWYSLGVDGSIQNSIEDATGANDGSNKAAGVDGMIDVPFGHNRVFAKAEFNSVSITPPVGGNSVDTKVWMAGAGLLTVNQTVQPFIRFDRILRDEIVGGGNANITYAGINFYQKGHSLKIQGDVRFESGTHEAVDGARIQAQVEI